MVALPLASAQELQAVPILTAHVMDSTGTLDAAQLQALEYKLTAFEQARGAQVVMLMVPTTQPEDIAAYAQRVGDSWKIGRKAVGDGLLLVVAKNDRKVRIETTKAILPAGWMPRQTRSSRGSAVKTCPHPTAGVLGDRAAGALTGRTWLFSCFLPYR